MQPKVIVIALLALVLVLGGGYYFYQSNQPTAARQDLVNSFDVSNEKIAKELEGRTAPLSYGQVWPFDPTQGLTVKIVQKKQIDEYVQVVAEISAKAEVKPPKTEKEEKTPPPGIKTVKVSLNGLVRLTYERINQEWFLIGVENISLKASPLVNE